MGSQCDIASFVLRFKQHRRSDAGGSPTVEWRAHIRHVQGDDEMCFTDLADAVAFIQARLASEEPALHEPSQPDSLATALPGDGTV